MGSFEIKRVSSAKISTTRVWVFALEILFNAGVVIAPEAGEVLPDLDRANNKDQAED